MNKLKSAFSSAMFMLLSLVLVLSLIMLGCNRRNGNSSSSSQDENSYSSSSTAASDSSDTNSSQDFEDTSSSNEASSQVSSDEPSNSSSSSIISSSSIPPISSSGSQGTISSLPSSSVASSSNVSKLKNVIYIQKGSYSKEESFQDATIKGSGILIRNKTFHGDVIITNDVESDGIRFENVLIKGTLSVKGGSGWLKLYDSQVSDLLLDYKNAKVYVSGNTDVEKVTVKKDATLQEGNLGEKYAGLENILLSGSSRITTKLYLKDLSANWIRTKSGAKVQYNSGTVIDVFYADAPTRLEGLGKIKRLIASSDNVYYQTRPDHISVTDGASIPKKISTSSWDDEKENNSSDKRDVWIDKISNKTLDQGEKKTLSIQTNAREIYASSNNSSIVQVSTNGKDEITLHALQVGTATITVKGKRAGYNSDTMRFDVTVQSSAQNAPQVTIVKGDPVNWTASSTVVLFTVVDDDLESVSVSSSGVIDTDHQGSFWTTITQNGTYIISAKDKKGNETQKSFEITKIDSSAPIIESISVVSEQLTEPTKNISISVLEQGGSGISEVALYNSQNIKVTSAVYQQGKIYIASVSQNGTYYAKAIDKAGNVSQSVPITVSSCGTITSPVIAETPILTPTSWTNTSVTVQFTVTDQRPVSVQVLDSNHKAKTVSNLGNSVYSFVADENDVYTVTAQNSSGLQSDRSYTISNIDKTAPVITVTQNDQNNWSQSKTIKFTVSDVESGLSNLPSVFSPNGLPVNIAPVNKNEWSFVVEENGTYTIEATNQAGSKKTLPVVVKRVDSSTPTAPTITQSDNPGVTIGSSGLIPYNSIFNVIGASPAIGDEKSAVTIYYQLYNKDNPALNTIDPQNPSQLIFKSVPINSYNVEGHVLDANQLYLLSGFNTLVLQARNEAGAVSTATFVLQVK